MFYATSLPRLCGAGCGGARRGPIVQGLISWWGPCPLEVPGRPKCGQGPGHKSRPCPSEPHGGAVLSAVKPRRGQGAAKMTRGTQGGRYREGPGRSASSERLFGCAIWNSVTKKGGFWLPMGFADSSVTKKGGFWLRMGCGDALGRRATAT